MNITPRLALTRLIALIALCALTACTPSESDTQASNEERILWDFEDEAILSSIKAQHSHIAIHPIDGDNKLVVNLHAKAHHKPSFTLEPKSPWNWSALERFALAMEIENPLPSSVHIYITAEDSDGQAHNRSYALPAQSKATYYMELNGESVNIQTGIRSNPPSWETDYTPLTWRWGSRRLNLTAVERLKFAVHGNLEDRKLIIDDLRIITPNKVDPNYLTGLVDQYGQNAKQGFENKITSDAQLIALHQEEQQTLSHTPPPGRSKYNGWLDGPKLEATGFFRTEKYKGKWSLVDPEGYLFFSNGIANIRMANTSTVTGYDFDSNYITPRSPKDYTPEDSIGLNPAPSEAWPSRHVTSSLRADMFTWLPTYNEPLGQHFGYRREVHTGAIPKGETYSFYRANLARKYQNHTPDELINQWRDTTVDRMLSWGFTSFGNWVDPMFYQLDRLPYFANGWIIGDFKTVSSGNDYWSPLPDPFDPVFKERAQVTAKKIASEVQNNPWCVGVFIDNEKSWGGEGTVEQHYGIVINTLQSDASQSPTKSAFVSILKQKYNSIENLNTQWEAQFSSWERFAEKAVITQFTPAAQQDFSTLLQAFADQYFSVVRDAVKQHLPNHMYLGARFADWGMTPELRAASAKYADVMSYNYYKEGINESFWTFLEEIDKPSIIGEFHNGALDSGLLNPGVVHAASQHDRGKRYKAYMHSVIDNPYFVGAHWFQYIDSPFTGRAYDGENYNVGFVSVADIPYQPLVDAAKEVNEQIYTRRFSPASK